MRILVVGGGVAGLTLANALKNISKKTDVNIIEKSKFWRPSGAGIAMPANANYALKKIGLLDTLKAHAHQVNKVVFATDKNEILTEGSLVNIHPDKTPFLAIERSKLHEILIENIKDVPVQFDTSVEAITYNNKAQVKLSDGNTKEYDLVIGADGVHSKVRKLISPNSNASYLGIKCWRFIVDKPETVSEPLYMAGRDDVFMLYPINDNKVYCYAHINDPEDKLNLTGETKLQKLLEIFSGYAGPVNEALKQITSHEQVIFSKLESSKEVFFGKENIILIGDAAHACSPMLQQGGAQAIEDAVILANIINQLNRPKEILDEFKKEREARVKWVVDQSDSRIKSLERLSDEQVMMRNEFLKKNGPLNVTGWKVLFNQIQLSKYCCMGVPSTALENVQKEDKLLQSQHL
jgi:2-polyprenyl-6-methoxyphenol hydroxylase-like FAD-dependent oxidoreductase